MSSSTNSVSGHLNITDNGLDTGHLQYSVAI